MKQSRLAQLVARRLTVTDPEDLRFFLFKFHSIYTVPYVPMMSNNNPLNGNKQKGGTFVTLCKKGSYSV